MKTIVVALALACSLSACSSIKSTESPESNAHGLTYFMPKQDIKVTVEVKGATKTVTVSTTDPYPDMSKHYLLNYSRNLAGKNEMEVNVSASGLLNGLAKSKTTAQTNDVFKSIAGTAGTFRAFNFMAAPDAELETNSCSADGTYVFFFDATATDTEGPACNLKVKIRRYSASIGTPRAAIPAIIPAHGKIPGQAHSGVFYRRTEPYLVTVFGGAKAGHASIQFSPSNSAAHYLPIARSLFANTEANFTMANGMLTQYKQDSDGELVGLLKLPADILTAYFAAVGAIFDAFKTRDSKEAAALVEATKLDVAKLKAYQCSIVAGDAKALAMLECGK